jgi:hypothetical protein
VHIRCMIEMTNRKMCASCCSVFGHSCVIPSPHSTCQGVGGYVQMSKALYDPYRRVG